MEQQFSICSINIQTKYIVQEGTTLITAIWIPIVITIIKTKTTT
ncbi:hypothetical protein [Bacteroides stercorirosoris]|nr:hypothetical protein [Bacteroides stercorirosoris]